MPISYSSGMNKNTLFSYFNTALGWNAAFYGFYKLTSAGLTIFLFKYLSSSWFSCWATGNSLIFLFVLWIDCGFKKSIPRFCPLYLGINYHRQFITKVIMLRCATLFISFPLVWFGMKYGWGGHPEMVPWVMFLFFSQGMATIFELLYHAHFWQREYAIMHTGSLLFEILCNIILLSSTSNHMSIVQGLFINKALGALVLTVLSSFFLPKLYRSTTLVCTQTEQEKELLKRSFIKYSLFMWWSTTIKSLSERNFLVPFFTMTLGQPIANTFKVANDAALIFQRTVLRTIGIADMSLLSYAMLNDTSELVQAFNHLMRTLILLIFPLATVTILLTKKFHTLETTELVFLFGTIIGGYMLEMLLSPYERLLEVQFKFRSLFKAYLPYVLGYTLLLIAISFQELGLVPYMILTQIVRLISSLCMCWYGYDPHNDPFPQAFLYKVAGACLIIIGATWYFL